MRIDDKIMIFGGNKGEVEIIDVKANQFNSKYLDFIAEFKLKV